MTDSSSGEEEFSEAAALLCRKVALAARLTRGQHLCVSTFSYRTRVDGADQFVEIQEVGYGSGDSTLLLAREFSPKSYIGFTSLAAQHLIACQFLLFTYYSRFRADR